MSYISQLPGSSNSVTLSITAYYANGSVAGSSLTVPALQDVTVKNANDVFTWEQLDSSSKLQVATLAVNAVDTNIVVDDTSFFGTGADTTSAAGAGIFGLSKSKIKCNVSLSFGTRTITANCYVTGLSPKITATQPVWITPLTLTVTGDYSHS